MRGAMFFHYLKKKLMLTCKTYNMKVRSLILLIVTLLIFSCSEDEIKPWKSYNYIHFSDDYQKVYSFVYAGSKVMQDTVWLRLNIAGNMSSEERTYKVKQVKAYNFIPESPDATDSVFIELPNQAIAGVHFVDFNTEEAAQQFIVPADSLGAYFPLIVLRDSSLRKNDYTLSLEVEKTDDFLPGNSSYQKITIAISDQVAEPSKWKDYWVGSKTVFEVMGYYGKVKHRLMIDATGQRWDDEFITKELTEEYLLFYRTLSIKELERINDERAKQGLHKLREDDNNPNSEVKFRTY